MSQGPVGADRILTIKKAASALRLGFCGLLLTLLLTVNAFAQADPLPSWNDTPTKQAIVAFVAKVTQTGGPDFVPERPAHRSSISSQIRLALCQGYLPAEARTAGLSRDQRLSQLDMQWQSGVDHASSFRGDVRHLTGAGNG